MKEKFLLELDRLVLLDESIRRLLDKIREDENSSVIRIENGFTFMPQDHLNHLRNKLYNKASERETIKRKLMVDEELLNEVYLELASKPDENKIAKLALLFELINEYNDTKEMSR